MIGIDKYAYSSKISKVSPKSKCLFGIFPLLLCIFLNSFSVSLLTIIIMIYAALKWGGISYKVFIKLLLLPVGFLLIGSITIMTNQFPLDKGLLIGVKLGNHLYGISSETFLNGIRISLKSLGAVSCMYFFSLNTPMNDFFNLLRKTKLPILVIELMELMYRFIFIIWEEGQRVYTSQSSRLGYVGFRNKLTSSAELISTIFLRAFRRVDRINASLESRGYDGSLNAFEEDFPPCKWMNKSCVLVCITLILVYIIERMVV